jgi:hypothetical protein
MNYAYFGIGLVHLQSSNRGEALSAFHAGLAVSNAPNDLEDALDELAQLQTEHPKLEAVTEVINLLKNWQPNNQFSNSLPFRNSP